MSRRNHASLHRKKDVKSKEMMQQGGKKEAEISLETKPPVVICVAMTKVEEMKMLIRSTKWQEKLELTSTKNHLPLLAPSPSQKAQENNKKKRPARPSPNSS